MSKYQGGPAFPVITPNANISHGMSMRQYYKGQALAGMLSNETALKAILDISKVKNRTDENTAAIICSSYADAMIAEDQEFENKQEQ